MEVAGVSSVWHSMFLVKISVWIKYIYIYLQPISTHTYIYTCISASMHLYLYIYIYTSIPIHLSVSVSNYHVYHLYHLYHLYLYMYISVSPYLLSHKTSFHSWEHVPKGNLTQIHKEMCVMTFITALCVWVEVEWESGGVEWEGQGASGSVGMLQFMTRLSWT